jgi:hypothetical protein
MPIKNTFIDFSDMSGGQNNAFPRHAIAENQVAITLNAIHEAIGTSRAPGYAGLSSSALFEKPIRGHFTYVLDNGTEYLICVSDSKIYSVDPSAGTKTQLGTLTGDGECYAVNAAGKLWIVNGTDFVKVESDLSVYRVQILVPAGTSATGSGTGGTLAAGVYGVYVAYARKDANGRYLYSLPYSLGNITLSGSTSKISFVVPASSDAQVSHRVVFMTNAGGAVPYFYGEATNASGDFDITSNASRNSSILMSTVSSANHILPITPDGIATFDDRIYVWDVNDRTVYWSLKTDVNPFDMERYLAENFHTLSYAINAVFPIGENLAFNHLGNGVSIARSGDMSSVIKVAQKAFWYLDCKTPDGKSNIVYHKGLAFGLTNDGFRFFDGEQFSEDVSFHIKPDVNSIYSGIGSFLPCAIVNRRSGKRTEYRFSYRNLSYGSGSNNDQRVFNLDFYFDPNNSKKTWECWENGFCGMAVVSNIWCGAQSVESGQVVKESGVSDINCYDRTGHFQTTRFVKQWYQFTRTVIDALQTITVWGAPYAFSTNASAINGNAILFDSNYRKFPFTIAGTSPTSGVLPAAGAGGLELPFVMMPQYPVGSCDPLPFDCRGNSITLELEQTADDERFFLYKLQLPRAKTIENNLT